MSELNTNWKLVTVLLGSELVQDAASTPLLSETMSRSVTLAGGDTGMWSVSTMWSTGPSTVLENAAGLMSLSERGLVLEPQQWEDREAEISPGGNVELSSLVLILTEIL